MTFSRQRDGGAQVVDEKLQAANLPAPTGRAAVAAEIGRIGCQSLRR
jgi:hypothetical protein